MPEVLEDIPDACRGKAPRREVRQVTAPDPRVGEIETRLAAATPGPWAWSRSRPFGPGVPPRFELVKPVTIGEFNGIPMHGHPLNIVKSDNEWQPSDADAEFIAAAPADVAYLLAELRKAHEALERVEAEVAATEELAEIVIGEDLQAGLRMVARGIRAAVAAANGDGNG